MAAAPPRRACFGQIVDSRSLQLEIKPFLLQFRCLRSSREFWGRSSGERVHFAGTCSSPDAQPQPSQAWPMLGQTRMLPGMSCHTKRVVGGQGGLCVWAFSSHSFNLGSRR